MVRVWQITELLESDSHTQVYIRMTPLDRDGDRFFAYPTIGDSLLRPDRNANPFNAWVTSMRPAPGGLTIFAEEKMT